MKYPTLSIITVCFNAESTFRDCIQSVAQDKTHEIEYLVIDGFSTDGTLDIIQEFPEIIDTLISEPDGGIFEAMNKGLKNALGDYVVFLNADDRFMPGAIPVILSAIRTARNDVDVFYGDWIGVDARGVEHVRRANHRLRWGYSLCHQAVVARRTIFPVPFGFNLRYRLCADFDLILAWQAQGARFKRIALPIVRFSEVGSSSKFIRRSAWETIVIALRRARSLWALVFSVRVALYVARAALFSRLRMTPRPSPAPHKGGSVGTVRIVVSAVNFTEGGPLTVLRECLASAAAELPVQCELVALVHSADLIQESRVRFVSIPSSKKSWFHRLYWEWFGFYRISRELRPALWLSLHDVTPRVSATRQAVYCHNPSPFYRIRLRDAMMEPRFFIFNQLYALLYRLFIGRNHCVIVQQEWLREEFIRRMGNLPVVVAHPSFRVVERPGSTKSGPAFVFIYPALPRVFKNMETLCAASQILAARGISGFEVRLTIDGSENRYSRWVRQRFGDTAQIQFIGRKTKDEMVTQYAQACAVVFPSKLETWGLPITEGKAQGLPLIVADLPYARETVGNYELVSFFPAESPDALADLMQAMIEQRWRPTGNHHPDPATPYAPDWASLWGILTSGLPMPEPTHGYDLYEAPGSTR